ncbi:4-hydroxythreonine-4-phosphate dehydrogenase PdxA [Pelagibacterales bacterium SAG-MED20]|nr:4-hydroxythreonine-4-phosphate dehydrogenase PdxA [Pelagibacterales bacterium SAG-MED20]
MNFKPIIIVAGEPNSVFSEIFFKAKLNNRVKNPIILIASKKLITHQMKKLKFKYKINLINYNNDLSILKNNKINLINVEFKFKRPFDKITDKSKLYIENCFNLGLQILKKQNCLGLINGPISKKNFLKKKYLGITEYLAHKTNKKNKVAMLIYNKKLSVSPITTHLPLKEVYKNISKKKIINHVKLIRSFYIKRFNKDPKIAITGLNPHCESNYKKSEEDIIIKPAIRNLIKKKFKVSGPFPADTIFLKEISKKYDVIVGMYHDQVLSPVKTLFGFNSINITLGLPFVRISPDHGPNSSMLGKNLSNPQSLIEAVKFLDK